MRFIDPPAARLAAIENDLLDPALLLPLVRGERQRIFELLEDDLHDALDFASFLCRKMIEAGAHGDNLTAQGALCTHETSIMPQNRSEEHTSELQSLMRISYAVFCLKKNKDKPKEK